MSGSEFEAPQQRSSFKISQNAKGEAQVEVRAVEGVAPEELRRLRVLAVGEYCEAVKSTRGPSPTPPGGTAGGT